MTDVFLFSDTETISFGELEVRKKNIIRKVGVPRPILLEADRNIETVVRFLSLIEGGHTVIMAPSWDFHSPEFRNSLIKQAETDFIPWAQTSEFPEGESTNSHPLITEALEKKTARFIVRTSGSTGKFKLVLHDPDLFIRKYYLIGKHFERTFLFSPPDSIAGIETVLEAFTHKASIAFSAGKIAPGLVTQTIEKFSVDYFQTTPTFLNLMMLAGVFRKPAPTGLSKIAFGSEPVQASVLDHIQESWKNVQLVQTYGMSEIGIQRTLPADDPRFFLLDGKLNPGRIINGLLEIQTLTPLISYLNFTSQITADGWFRTHDEVKENGKFLSVPGREGDLINVAGRKFFPSELEELLMKIPDIHDVTVRSVPDEFAGTILLAEIYIHPESIENEIRRTVKTFLENSVPTYMHPQRICVLSELPQTGRFKKMRR